MSVLGKKVSTTLDRRISIKLQKLQTGGSGRLYAAPKLDFKKLQQKDLTRLVRTGVKEESVKLQ